MVASHAADRAGVTGRVTQDCLDFFDRLRVDQPSGV